MRDQACNGAAVTRTRERDYQECGDRAGFFSRPCDIMRLSYAAVLFGKGA